MRLGWYLHLLPNEVELGLLDQGNQKRPYRLLATGLYRKHLSTADNFSGLQLSYIIWQVRPNFTKPPRLSAHCLTNMS